MGNAEYMGDIEDQLKNKEIELKRNQYQGNNLESDRQQYETEMQIVQVKYESECIAHQNTEKLRKMYESKAKNLEMEMEKYQSQVIGQEIQIDENVTKIAEIQEKYEKERTTHQQVGSRKDTYKKQAMSLETKVVQLKSQIEA